MSQSLITDHFHEKQNVIIQLEIAPKRSHRIKGKKYLFKGETRIWNGKGWHCEHDKRRSRCKECGGSSICEHGRRRSQCKECGGASICEHDRIRSQCKECDPEGYLTGLMRSRVYKAMKRYSSRKSKKTMEYVGCDAETLRKHLESQFLPLMTWKNQGKWHIDHRKPCASFDLSIESERHKCFHYTNLQPLWGPDNMSKNDSFDPDSFCFTWIGDSWVPISDD